MADISTTTSTTTSSNNANTEVKTFQLKAEQELRIETATDQDPLKFKLTQGTAELFGMELALDREYSVTDAKVAIFTWNGCQIQVTGATSLMYVSDETPMISFINTHAAINQLRNASKDQDEKGTGPRVVIAGPTDVGKSTLCKILLNYAYRAGWKPTHVDLDVGQNDIAVPGTIAASPVEHPLSMEDDPLSVRTPIVYYLGSTSPNSCEGIYRILIENLAASIESRFQNNAHARHSGMIINTCGWIEGEGYELLIHLAHSLKADVILSLGDERLFNQLKSDNRLQNIVVSKLPKSGGVVTRDSNYRRKTRMKRIRDYFYGRENELHPQTRTLHFKDFHLFRLGGVNAPSSHLLPIGAKPLVDPNRPLKIEASSDLLHAVLAISYANDTDSLLNNNIAGLAHVTQIDTRKRTVTLLLPTIGPLPSHFVLCGSLKWFD